MPFIANPATPADEAPIENFSGFWPAFEPAAVRAIMRLESDVTPERLAQLLQNAILDVNEALNDFVAEKQADGLTFNDLPAESQHQYRRAVYATAQAQLLEDMIDYDTTATGTDRAESVTPAIGVQQRSATLAIRSIKKTMATPPAPFTELI